MGSSHAKCLSKVRLDEKTAIVTGANTGIGKETVQDFFVRGARVIMACRNLEKANEAADDIKQKCNKIENTGHIVVSQLDLTSFASVRNFSNRILENEKRIDILVNNAGIMMCPKSKTQNGFETQFGTNHLGHFLLTLLLLPKIIKSGTARIVNVSSKAHEQGKINFDDFNYERRSYSALGAYQQSKLANVLFTNELHRKISEANITGVNVYSLHPGIISTDLARNVDDTYFRGARLLMNIAFAPFKKTAVQGAQTQIFCSLDEKCAKESGLYYAECAVKTPSQRARNEEDAKRLWDESIKLVGFGPGYDVFKQ